MKRKTKEITYEILKLLAAGVILTIVFIAPGMAIAFKECRRWGKFDKRRLKENLKRLKKQKMIGFRQTGNETTIQLTDKGRIKFLKYNLDKMRIKKPHKWDKLWRIVIFDVPEKKKLARDTLREKLDDLGFLKIQKSVFIYPYECKKEIDFITNIYEIKSYVEYIVAKKIEDEHKIKTYFKLNH
jgi:CRISPR-associated endonuclease Cas2